jgi:methylamine---corrinoid protein Co-methyltransferase
MPGLFFDTMVRMHEGPRVKEKEFDLEVSRLSKELVEKYDIRYDPENVVVNDDAMADRLFAGAMEFAVKTGLWCLDTSRVVRFSEAEILEFHTNYHSPIWIGHGKDQVLLQHRLPESTTRPLVLGGGAGSEMTSGEMYVKHCMNFALEPTADTISQGTPHSIEGMMIRPGSPIEIHGVINEVGWIRDALRRSGRPGMPLVVGPGCATTAAAGIAAMNEERGIRKNDFIIATMLTEMKTEYDPLARAVAFVENGLNVIALYAPMVGGWAGGPEGAALVGTATCLLAGPAYAATMTIHHPVHMNLKSGATTRPETLYIESISGQAMSRNTRFPMGQNNFFDARPGTKECLYEAAANAIVAVTSGQHVGPGPSGVIGGEDQDFITGIEQRMMGEVTRAVTGMSRKEGNEIVKMCMAKYMPTSGKQSRGKKMPELYDVEKSKPLAEWLGMFEEVKKEVRGWGVPFLY